jgi:hypothetical protein
MTRVVDASPAYKTYASRSETVVVPIPRKQARRDELESRIHELARVGACSFEVHVFDRSQKQGTDIHDAFAVLASGTFKGEIEPLIDAGELRCKMVATVHASERRRGVVTVVVKGLHLFITAVEWAQR